MPGSGTDRTRGRERGQPALVVLPVAEGDQRFVLAAVVPGQPSLRHPGLHAFGQDALLVLGGQQTSAIVLGPAASSSASSPVPTAELGERGRRHLLAVADHDDRRCPGPSRRPRRPPGSARPRRRPRGRTIRGRGGKNRASESGLTSMHGMIAVISSPYRASNPRTGRPRRCLASSRCSSPTWPSPEAASKVRRSSTWPGIDDVSSAGCRRRTR